MIRIRMSTDFSRTLFKSPLQEKALEEGWFFAMKIGYLCSIESFQIRFNYLVVFWTFWTGKGG
jgi:hypothetical protein